MIDLPFVSVGELPPYEINKLPAVVRVPLDARMERAFQRVSNAYRNRFQTAPLAQGGNMHGRDVVAAKMAGASEERQSQVGNSIIKMSNTVERLAHAVDRLESRISPALRPSTPPPATPANRIEKVQEMRAPVADAIEVLTQRAEIIEGRLMEITDRVEV